MLHTYTNLCHLIIFLSLPEILPCVPAATVFSAISGSARCHRVHLTEPLLLFISHKELKLASYYSYQQLCQDTNEESTQIWCQIYSSGSINSTNLQEYTKRMFVRISLLVYNIPMPYHVGASTLGTSMVLCTYSSII